MKRIAAVFLMVFASLVSAQDVRLEETRFCGVPARNKDGTIARSSSVLAAFKKRYACPATGMSTGACPGWAIDHVIPLACGGCDHVSNLQWLPDDIKSKAVTGKDRFERRIYETSVPCNPSAK